MKAHVSLDDITFVGRIDVWGIECSGTSIYLREIKKYINQESRIMLDFNFYIDWVAFFIGEASSCLLSRGRFRFSVRVSTEAFVLELPCISQNKASLHSILHTFESKVSFRALLLWRKMVFPS